MKSKLGDGSTPNQGFMGKLLSAGSRLIAGKSILILKAREV
jgi:hypothetical protein